MVLIWEKAAFRCWPRPSPTQNKRSRKIKGPRPPEKKKGGVSPIAQGIIGELRKKKRKKRGRTQDKKNFRRRVSGARFLNLAAGAGPCFFFCSSEIIFPEKALCVGFFGPPAGPKVPGHGGGAGLKKTPFFRWALFFFFSAPGGAPLVFFVFFFFYSAPPPRPGPNFILPWGGGGGRPRFFQPGGPVGGLGGAPWGARKPLAEKTRFSGETCPKNEKKPWEKIPKKTIVSVFPPNANKKIKTRGGCLRERPQNRSICPWQNTRGTFRPGGSSPAAPPPRTPWFLFFFFGCRWGVI